MHPKPAGEKSKGKNKTRVRKRKLPLALLDASQLASQNLAPAKPGSSLPSLPSSVKAPRRAPPRFLIRPRLHISSPHPPALTCPTLPPPDPPPPLTVSSSRGDCLHYCILLLSRLCAVNPLCCVARVAPSIAPHSSPILTSLSCRVALTSSLALTTPWTDETLSDVASPF